MEYQIRFATQADYDDIVEYIDSNWKKNHILVRSSKLFHWQYDGESDRLNFVLGINQDNELQGLLGFIKYDGSEDSDICLALWKANSGTGFLGLELLKCLMENVPHRAIVCTGINLKTTGKIYNFLGIKVREMKQWYRLFDRDEYKIAVVKEKVTIEAASKCCGEFRRIWSAEELPKNIDTDYAVVPFKDRTYLRHRYFDHPEYEYMVYTYTSDTTDSHLTLVVRIQEHDKAKVLRIVDGIGDWKIFTDAIPYIDSLIVHFGCEYADFYESGLDDNLLCTSGWRKVGEDENVIPDYFSPFEQRNVKIYCATSSDEAILFKGDGDQDRPN